MSPEMIALVIGGVIAVVTLVSILVKFAPKPVRKTRFHKKWRQLQKNCATKETWPKAITEADKLLDQALKRRHYKGRNIGERLVSAQKVFTDNESVWWSHKLAKKLQDDPDLKLRKKEVKDALLAFGQALKDVGALR